MMWGSVPQIAVARTRQSTSYRPGRGCWTSRIAKSFGPETTSARIRPRPRRRAASIARACSSSCARPRPVVIIDNRSARFDLSKMRPDGAARLEHGYPRTTGAHGVTVNRVMLRDQIKDVLLQRILNGGYAPGERIVETRVAEEFGVSQATVREALRELEILRLIVSEPFRGVRVREVRPQEIAEIYPVRAALEEVAARAAAPRLVDRVEPLEKEIAAMRSAAGGDLHRFVRHDVAFHRLFVEASANQTLIEV